MNETDDKPFEVSIILPCRNEEDSLEFCIRQIKTVFALHNIHGEIIVSDSSHDRSCQIATALGVRIVRHDRVGYGIALRLGFSAAAGRYVFIADPDSTYDFNEIATCLDHLRNGYDMVIGNRFKGRIEAGAMPWLRRHIGNPCLSRLLALCFRIPRYDTQCGLRAIDRTALLGLDLKTCGMELASEMLIKAARHDLRIKEIPIDYFRRKGSSKLRPLRDGWRHLICIFKLVTCE